MGITASIRPQRAIAASTRASVAAASLIATLAGAAHASVDDGVRRLSFDVFLDDRAIGYQRFALTPAGDGTRIETQARFEVKLLRITAFAYDHRNTELWRGGCLRSIDAATDSNGKKSAVSGRTQGNAFVVATKDGERALGERALGDCVASFAYWDKGVLLRSKTLLNSQTGDYVTVEVRSLGKGSLSLGGRDVRVERLALSGRDIDITLAYSVDSGEWLALDSRLDNGKTLRYRRAD